MPDRTQGKSNRENPQTRPSYIVINPAKNTHFRGLQEAAKAHIFATSEIN
jgi:hypothetical protein